MKAALLTSIPALHSGCREHRLGQRGRKRRHASGGAAGEPEGSRQLAIHEVRANKRDDAMAKGGDLTVQGVGLDCNFPRHIPENIDG